MGLRARGGVDLRVEHRERAVLAAHLEGFGRAVVKLDTQAPRFERELLALRHARAANTYRAIRLLGSESWLHEHGFPADREVEAIRALAGAL